MDVADRLAIRRVLELERKGKLPTNYLAREEREYHRRIIYPPLVPYERPPRAIQHHCGRCGTEFTARRRDARYCSPRCRVIYHRQARRLERDAKYRCTECDALSVEEPDGPLYECGGCGNAFTRATSVDGDGNRCPECNRFGAKIAAMGCDACGAGEVEERG